MAAPGSIPLVCGIIVYPFNYPQGGFTPSVWIGFTLSAVDAVSTGILGRIERCTGSGCSGFAFVANSAGIRYPTTTPPQGEYTDSSVAANQVYRYRVRLENSDGVGPYTNPIEIDGRFNSTGLTGQSSACDPPGTGLVSETISGVVAVVEAVNFEQRATAMVLVVEAGGNPIDYPPGGSDPGGGGGGGGLVGETDICGQL